MEATEETQKCHQMDHQVNSILVAFEFSRSGLLSMSIQIKVLLLSLGAFFLVRFKRRKEHGSQGQKWRQSENDLCIEIIMTQMKKNYSSVYEKYWCEQ